MTKFTTITIIYNPNSTGPSKRLAEECHAALKKQLPKVNLALTPTEYAGHAEELAYAAAKESKHPLVISSSGDGGYHEVVNGIMQAHHEGSKAVAGLLPGGNANDHYNRLHKNDFVTSVISGKTRSIDVLKLSGVRNGESFDRYAHSYIGLGFTPWVGQRLTRAKLNRLNEVLITFQALMAVRTTRLVVGRKEQAYRSLVFTNIGRMAKFLNLAHGSKVDDGKFEISVMPARTRLHMFASIFKASTIGLTSTTQAKHYRFKTVKRTLVQLDGEIRKLDPDSAATVGIERRALRCIV